ncbi:MAG TPA: hypothetical protein VKP30_01790, partial [Polyangiaceae bacterium]|nr:hypothetical protein [Polyangiaceae bacterium]
TPLAGLGSITDVHHAEETRVKATSIPARASKTAVHHSSFSAEPSRHEFTGLPDTNRREVQEIVRGAVSPVLDRVRELEKTVTELRMTLARVEQQALAAKSVAREPTTSVRAPQPTHYGESATRLNPSEIVPAYDHPKATDHAPTAARESHRAPDAMLLPVSTAARAPAPSVQQELPDSGDVPWELSGSRRRAMVAWIVGTLAALVLLATCGAAILSQLGY